jgi:hypothetical protein
MMEIWVLEVGSEKTEGFRREEKAQRMRGSGRPQSRLGETPSGSQGTNDRPP